MYKKYFLIAVLFLGSPFAPAAQASLLTSTLSQIDTDTWQYDYNLTPSNLLTPGNGFSVFFNAGEASNLVPVSAPADWDAIVIQPGSVLGDSPGWYDALWLGAGDIGAGQTVGVFSVQFDWLLSSLPPSDGQAFELYFLDLASDDFQVLGAGVTSPVPLPAAFWLFASALAGLGFARRRGPGSLQKG